MTSEQREDASATPEAIGFIGVGTLATAMVRGLRSRWPDLDINLSPRSERLSSALATHDPSIRRHATNASVVEASGLVVLTMRPPQFEEAVSGLPFRRDQLVLSCLSGIGFAGLRELCAPAEVVRALPVPAIERREGPLILCPPSPRASAVFAGVCDLVEVADEAALTAIWPASTFMSSYFALQAKIIDRMTTEGADAVAASRYVRSLLRALAETSVRTEPFDLERLVSEHETPGGLNFRVRTMLEREGWFTAVAETFDSTSRLRGADLTVSDKA